MIEHNIRAWGVMRRLISAMIIVILMIHTSIGLGGTASGETISAEETPRVSLWSTIVSGGPIGFVIILAFANSVLPSVLQRFRFSNKTIQLLNLAALKRTDKLRPNLIPFCGMTLHKLV